MPKMTRTHYRLVGEATRKIIERAKRLIPDADQAHLFALEASKTMADSLAGTNSQFKHDRFRGRCLGTHGGR